MSHVNSFGRYCRPWIGVAILVMAVLAVCHAPTVRAASASQIVVVCTTPNPSSHTENGCRSSELVSTPPIIVGNTLYFVGGMWVWCQSPIGGTPYGPQCNGAMYLEEVDLATGIGKYEARSIGGTSSVGGLTGLQETITTSDGDMTCTFDVPTSPSSGQSNNLAGFCGGVPIVFTNVNIKVT